MPGGHREDGEKIDVTAKTFGKGRKSYKTKELTLAIEQQFF